MKMRVFFPLFSRNVSGTKHSFD